MIELRIEKQDAGKKAHRYLRQLLPGVPLSGIHKMLRTGRVKRAGKRVKADDVLMTGDILHLYMADDDFARVRKSPRKFVGVNARVNVRYEDERMLVVAKPAGLLVHGAEKEYKDTLVNRVAAYLYHAQSTANMPTAARVFTPAPVHRLDRNTSGLVVFAKTADAARALSAQIAGHEVTKRYWAIVVGEMAKSGVIRARIQRNQETNVTLVGKEGKPAETHYQPLMTSSGTTLVQVNLISGRTHQIRAHLSHIGHPLLGDAKYGAPRSKDDPHYWLHAGELVFPNGLRITAPLPDAFEQRLSALGYDKDTVQRLAP
ncbi:RluA family pseudouridine synthase [Alicyclobacillus herbarius]|uniref:RluA family pseudouridine synthase n=1 Tax=Alicyclobacillus herbarius TaxID=122960 RepID=UPI000414A595|nr:RluA family pseudouridine synthase [Alicyclobacillus herbarius]